MLLLLCWLCCCVLLLFVLRLLLFDVSYFSNFVFVEYVSHGVVFHDIVSCC